MPKLKRYNLPELFKAHPGLKRRMVCEGTVVIQAREGIVVDIAEVYDIYDRYTCKGLRMPDGYPDIK
jgi:hypothetical protein